MTVRIQPPTSTIYFLVLGEAVSRDLELLAQFTFDCWLLARAAKSSFESPVDGRSWERTVADLLPRSYLPNRQRAGLTTLFGVRAASGVAHELDACAAGGRTVFLVECKSQMSGATKADVALFHEKTLDFFCARPQRFARQLWWRVVVSSNPVPASVRAFCLGLGLVVTEPGLLPLPVVLRVAARTGADIHLREALLQDVLRLGERAQVSLQERWIYDPQTTEIRFKPAPPFLKETQDLLWLQEELGSDILDLYDLYRPGALKRRSQELVRKLRP